MEEERVRRDICEFLYQVAFFLLPGRSGKQRDTAEDKSNISHVHIKIEINRNVFRRWIFLDALEVSTCQTRQLGVSVHRKRGKAEASVDNSFYKKSIHMSPSPPTHTTSPTENHQMY